jgi:hypothetical protein
MIKLMLRHLIIEQCITMFFSSIVKNFLKPVFSVDIADMIGADVKFLMIKHLTKEIEAEIDREIIKRMHLYA